MTPLSQSAKQRKFGQFKRRLALSHRKIDSNAPDMLIRGMLGKARRNKSGRLKYGKMKRDRKSVV